MIISSTDVATMSKNRLYMFLYPSHTLYNGNKKNQKPYFGFILLLTYRFCAQQVVERNSSIIVAIFIIVNLKLHIVFRRKGVIMFLAHPRTKSHVPSSVVL